MREKMKDNPEAKENMRAMMEARKNGDEAKQEELKKKMRENLARALGMDVGGVSVKAGTNEKLDAIGKGEAVKAVAIVLVEK